MQALLATAAQSGVRYTTTLHSACHVAAALQCRSIVSAHQTAAQDAYDVVVFGGGMVGVAFAALLGACTCFSCSRVDPAAGPATAGHRQYQSCHRWLAILLQQACTQSHALSGLLSSIGRYAQKHLCSAGQGTWNVKAAAACRSVSVCCAEAVK